MHYSTVFDVQSTSSAGGRSCWRTLEHWLRQRTGRWLISIWTNIKGCISSWVYGHCCISLQNLCSTSHNEYGTYVSPGYYVPDWLIFLCSILSYKLCNEVCDNHCLHPTPVEINCVFSPETVRYPRLVRPSWSDWLLAHRNREGARMPCGAQ